MPPSHAWEEANYQGHAWEALDNPGDSDEEEPTPERQFIEELLTPYNLSQVSAKYICILCFWLTKIGISDEIGKFGLSPDADSGHFQRHLDKVLGFSKDRREEYHLTVPGNTRRGISRDEFELAVLPPEEVLDQELAEHYATIGTRLREAKADRELPDTYYDHPTVVNNPLEDVLPIGIYMDGFPYSKTDSVHAMWVVNLITQHRRPIAIIRSRVMCRCGCRGWCTMWVLLQWLWTRLRALASGTFSTCRHDGTAWDAQDLLQRAARGGQVIATSKCFVLISLA